MESEKKKKKLQKREKKEVEDRKSRGGQVEHRKRKTTRVPISKFSFTDPIFLSFSFPSLISLCGKRVYILRLSLKIISWTHSKASLGFFIWGCCCWYCPTWHLDNGLWPSLLFCSLTILYLFIYILEKVLGQHGKDRQKGTETCWTQWGCMGSPP